MWAGLEDPDARLMPELLHRFNSPGHLKESVI